MGVLPLQFKEGFNRKKLSIIGSELFTILNIDKEIKPREDKKPYSDLIQYVEDRPGHDFRYAIDANKIKKEEARC